MIIFRLCRAQNDEKDQILNIRVFQKMTFSMKIENLGFWVFVFILINFYDYI